MVLVGVIVVVLVLRLLSSLMFGLLLLYHYVLVCK